MSRIVNAHIGPGQPAEWERTEDGFLRCRARVLREGVMPYARAEFTCDIPDHLTADPIQMLVTVDTMSAADALRSLEGASVVVGDHEWVLPENAAAVSHGHVAGAPHIVGPYTEVDILVTEPNAIRRIETGEVQDISAGYHSTTVFEPGDWDGNHYDAKQTQLRYNHIAVIPLGHGRAGRDVKILNEKGAPSMNVRVKLGKTGRYINTDENGAKDVEAENAAVQESDGSFESTMGTLEEKNSAMEALQAEIEELKGELSTYKQRLDELMSDEAVEGKAMEMMADKQEAEEIVENACDDEKKEEVKNSLKSLHGKKLYAATLDAIGVNTEGMSEPEIKGAFRAQNQISKKFRRTPTVAGAAMTGKMAVKNTAGAQKVERTYLEKLGYKTK
jgi:hypothetical protein